LAKEFDCLGSMTDTYAWTAVVPVAPPPPVPLKVPAAGAKVYTVAKGDNLWKIAQRSYGNANQTNVDKIYAANRAVIGSNPNLIQPGQKLTIP
jgi:nucleoid-associated protein YgaU